MVKTALIFGLSLFSTLGCSLNLLAQEAAQEGKYKPKLISLHVGYASHYVGRSVFTRSIVKFSEQSKFELVGGIKYHINRDVPNVQDYAYEKRLYAISAWNIPGLQLGFNYQLFSIKEKLKVQLGYLLTYSKLELQYKSIRDLYHGDVIIPFYLRTYPIPIYENYLTIALKYRITKNIQLVADFGGGMIFVDKRKIKLYKNTDTQGIYGGVARELGYTFSFGLTYDLFRVKTSSDKNSK